jgi:hypothetical protein
LILVNWYSRQWKMLTGKMVQGFRVQRKAEPVNVCKQCMTADSQSQHT